MSDAAHMTADAHGHDQPHIVPLTILFVVYVALLILTALTYGVTFVDVGAMNLWIALLVAVAKAGLVGLYFMHLRYDAPFNGFILCASLLFVALFIGFALMDSLSYQTNFDTPLIAAGQ